MTRAMEPLETVMRTPEPMATETSKHTFACYFREVRGLQKITHVLAR